MRTKNRKVLKDVTPGNTPQSKRSVKSTAKFKDVLLGSTGRIPALNLSAVDEDDEAPCLTVLPTPYSPVVARAGLAKQARSPERPARVAHTARQPAAQSRREAFSPLPPSSPPSISSLDENVENRPPLEPEYEDDNEDEENNYADDENVARTLREAEEDELPIVQETHASSSDDPFGFSALERRFRIQRELEREHRRRSAGFAVPLPSSARSKGKEVIRPRVPFGILAAAGSTSAHSRAPTPYHPSDDLEDMYLNPEPPHPPPKTDDLYVPEEPEPLAPAPALLDPILPSESEESRDPLSTPHPRHVANIIPLASPFSSREATPCDRSLPESPLSSPSPVKPLTVTRPLPVTGSTTKKKERGRAIAGRVFPSSTPVSTPLLTAKKALSRPATVKPVRPMLPPEMPKREVQLEAKKITQMKKIIQTKKANRKANGKANEKAKAQKVEKEEEQDPMVISRNLEKLLPKRTVRRPAKISAAPVETSQPRSRGRPRKRPLSPQESEAENGGESSGDAEGPSSPLATRKRKAPVRRTQRARPAKRLRAEVVITRPPPHLRRRTSNSSPVRLRAKPSSSKPISKPMPVPAPRKSAKAKGKEKKQAGLQKVGDEDSDEARARLARIEYFRSLDANYKMAKEDVYVV